MKHKRILILLSLLFLFGCQKESSIPETASAAEPKTTLVTTLSETDPPETIPEEEPDDGLLTPCYYLDFTAGEDPGFYSEHHMQHTRTDDGILFSALGEDPLIHIPAPKVTTQKLAYAAIVYKTSLTGIQCWVYRNCK